MISPGRYYSLAPGAVRFVGANLQLFYPESVQFH